MIATFTIFLPAIMFFPPATPVALAVITAGVV